MPKVGKVKYDLVVDCHDGFACVRKNGQEFHILPDGSPAYQERYDMVAPFEEGDLAWVMKDGEEFHICHDGSPAYAERFDAVSDFSKGLALAEKDGVEFYIRPDGSRVD